MSLGKGIAGYRGKPIGLFLHNDAGSVLANAKFYQNWLPNHDLTKGFANAYVANDGTLFAEDDDYATYHCANYYYNHWYYSIEICQSQGDLENFKKNEEKALRLAAQKCKMYGIVPGESTIMLHQEVVATACPHRSVEIHGGAASTKAYFIRKIKEYMAEDYGWIKDKIGWWYRYDNGNYPRTRWVKLDAWYYFDERGYALQNTWKFINGYWYYFGNDCRMDIGWKLIDGYWYYMTPKKVGKIPEGAMLTGWQYVNKKWYYLRPEREGNHPKGSMVTGLFNDGKHDYYCNEDGVMKVGWVKIEDVWYYFNAYKHGQPIGSMFKNYWLNYKGADYYLKEDGKMAAGETLTIEGKEYSFDEEGKSVAAE